MHPRVRAAARTAVGLINTPIAKRRFRTSLEDAPQPIKLELGGIAPRAGWLVTNVNPLTRNYLDATVTWPLADHSVSHVFADNVIEHITLDAGRAMLAEAYRCMMPGGRIRLVTPDIRGHVEMYLAGAASLDSEAARHYRTYKALTIEHPIDLVRIPIASFGHHAGYVYDFETLDAELTRAGFHDVVRCPLGDSSDPTFAGLDVRGDEGGAQIAVEAAR